MGVKGPLLHARPPFSLVFSFAKTLIWWPPLPLGQPPISPPFPDLHLIEPPENWAVIPNKERKETRSASPGFEPPPLPPRLQPLVENDDEKSLNFAFHP